MVRDWLCKREDIITTCLHPIFDQFILIIIIILFTKKDKKMMKQNNNDEKKQVKWKNEEWIKIWVKGKMIRRFGI